jgi:hypothetical protein
MSERGSGLLIVVMKLLYGSGAKGQHYPDDECCQPALQGRAT